MRKSPPVTQCVRELRVTYTSISSGPLPSLSGPRSAATILQSRLEHESVEVCLALLVNTTADTHPIHLHLVTFEVIDRRPFDVNSYDPETQAITYTGPAVPALPNEKGRKDTVQAHPGEVTRIRARFELPDEGTIELPAGVDNPQYVWHCHILEHEENDMMRAFEVVR